MGILETLVTQEDWITISELAALIGASERTVAGDVNLIQRQWGPRLHIEISTKYGVRMQNQSISAIGIVFKDLFNASTTLSWLEELLFSPGQGIEFYEERLFVSRSTLLRRLPKINRFFSGRKMSVRGKNNRYEITGKDEQYLRQFYAGFLLELYGLNLQKHPIDLELAKITQIVQQILAKNLSENEIACTCNLEIAVAYYTMFYIVSLMRENAGYQLPSAHLIEEEISQEDWNYIRKNFSAISIESLRPIHAFIVDQFHGWDSKEEEQLVSDESEAFFKGVFEAMDIPVDRQTLKQLRYILKTVYLTAKFRPYATSMLFDRIHIFSLSIQKHNAPVYKLIQEHLELFNRKIRFDMSRQFPDILYWCSLACPAFTSYTATKSVLVVSDLGLQHAEYLAGRLSSFSLESKKPILHATAAAYPAGLELIRPEEYDIIVTTIPELPIRHKNIFVINDFLSYKNFYEIYQSCLPD